MTSVISISDSKEISPDDVDFKNITSSLTRKQAEAVKRRVNKINAKVKERLSLQETIAGPQRLFVPENIPNSSPKQRADVRSLFPTQTVGEASNKPTPPFKSRHSYSEGVTLSRSEVMYLEDITRLCKNMGVFSGTNFSIIARNYWWEMII